MENKSENIPSNSKSSPLSAVQKKSGKSWTLVLKIAFSLSVLFVIGMVSLNYWLGAGGLTSMVNRACRENLDKTCKIQMIEASLVRGFRIVGVEVGGESFNGAASSASTPLLKIEEVRFRIDWSSLFRIALKIDELMIENTAIEIACVDLHCNYSPMLQRISNKENPKPSPPDQQQSIADLVRQIANISLPVGVQISNLGFRNANIGIKTQRGSQISDNRIRNFDLILNAKAHLPRIQLGIDAAFGELILDSNHFSGRTASVRLEALTSPSQNAISVARFSVDAERILQFQLNAGIAASEGQSALSTVEGDAQLALNLKEVGQWIKSMFPQVEMNGGTTSLELKIPKQTINLDQVLSNITSHLPEFESSLKLDDIEISALVNPDTTIATNGLSSAFKIRTNHSEGTASILNFQSDMVIPALTLSSKLVPGKVHALGTKWTSSAEVDLGNQEISDLKINIANDGLQLLSGGRTLTSTKVDFNFVGKTQNSYTGDLKLRIDKLIGLTGQGSITKDFNNLDAKISIGLENIDSSLALVRPILQSSGMGEHLPRSLAGSVDITLSAAAKELKSFQYNRGEVVRSKNADFLLSTDARISNFSIDDPARGSKINDLEFVLNLDASPQKQKLNLSTQAQHIRVGADHLRPLNILAIDLLNPQIDLQLSNQFSRQTMRLETARTSLKFDHKIQSSRIELQKQTYESPLEIHLLAGQQGKSEVKLSNLEVRIPNLGASAALQGSVSVDSEFVPQEIDSALSLELANTASLADVGNLKTSGRMRANISGHSDLKTAGKVDGRFEFEQLHLQIGDGPENTQIRLIDVNGALPFRQQFTIADLQRTREMLLGKPRQKLAAKSKAADDLQSRIKRYLDARTSRRTETASVVDYKSQKPASKEDLQLRIAKILVKGFEVGNLNFDFEVKQNYLSLNEFNAQLLGGSIQGSSFLAFNQLNPELDVSFHFTGLNTRNLLNEFPAVKRRASSWNLLADPYIGGAANLRVDLANREINGRMDLTQVGLEQVRMMLYYLDPNQKDPSIKSVIKILNAAKLVAGIERVSVPIESGLIDMAIQMKLAGAPIPLPKIEQFPLGRLISNIVTEKLQKTEVEVDSDAH